MKEAANLSERAMSLRKLERAMSLRKLERAMSLRKLEHSHLSQIVKCTFLNAGDKGSSYFHNLIKKNQKRRFIVAIALEDGSLTKSESEIGQAFVCHFQNLLGSSLPVSPASVDVCNNGKLVNLAAFSLLLQEVSSEEVWGVVSSMGNTKAPGPDGFNALFFKKAWTIIGPDIVAAVREFFSSGKLLKQLNHASISLVPKCANASKVNDFRPISCCNVIYKIISKILANRIAPVLDDIVGETQAAFLGDHLMHENIYLVQELLRKYARKRISPRCMLKIDLLKAYDTLSWDFLRWIPSSIGFPQSWLYWPQAKHPFSINTSNYINSLDAEQDIKLLKFYGWELSLDCARTLRISTMLLKKGAERGLSPFVIGSFMCRETLKRESMIEQIVPESWDSVVPGMCEVAFLEAVSLVMDSWLDKLAK